MNEDQLKLVIQSLSTKLSNAEISHSLEQAKTAELDRQLQEANAKIAELEAEKANVGEEKKSR